MYETHEYGKSFTGISTLRSVVNGGACILVHMHVTHTRSVAKGVSWRVIATGTTMIVVYIFTKDLALVAGVGALESTAKIALYYAHERAWLRVPWGINS